MSLTNFLEQKKKKFTRHVELFQFQCQIVGKKNVNLVKGGTGFLGKILIEKLLRSCQDISTIYLLMRGKKDRNIEDRMEDIFNDSVRKEKNMYRVDLGK